MLESLSLGPCAANMLAREHGILITTSCEIEIVDLFIGFITANPSGSRRPSCGPWTLKLGAEGWGLGSLRLGFGFGLGLGGLGLGVLANALCIMCYVQRAISHAILHAICYVLCTTRHALLEMCVSPWF